MPVDEMKPWATSARLFSRARRAMSAWARLVRVQHDLVNAVEDELKQTGFPPLAWYDALLELSRAENGYLRPLELERAMLFPHYAMSRLIDRLEEASTINPAQLDHDSYVDEQIARLIRLYSIKQNGLTHLEAMDLIRMFYR